MELSKLKKRLVSAVRGHKLLKDKQDELMRQFLILIRDNKSLRKKTEEAIMQANAHMAVAGSVMRDEVMRQALMLPKQELRLDVTQKNVMGVTIPVFNTEYKTNDTSDIYSYGYAFTSSELDDAVTLLAEVLPMMLRLAEIEKSCQLIASEIQKTRRRVNALEHIMIPRYRQTIKYITMKLDENERSATIRLMKVKDMMIKQQIELAQAKKEE